MADIPAQGVPTPQDLKTEQSGQAPEAVDPRIAAFAAKERQLRKMQMEMQAEKAKWEQEATKYQTDYLPKSRLQEDPLAVLSEMGYDTDKLSQLLLNAPNANDPTVRMFQSKIKALEEKQAAADRRAEEAVRGQFEQAKKQIANEAKMLVDGSADYETIKSAGMHDAVTELILQTFEQSGVLMDVAEAAQQVEEHLINEGMKFAQISKIQKRMQPQQAAPTGQPQAGIKTITQNLTQPQSGKSMTAAEKRARAIAAFNGQLK
jgi:hypothetical protein